MPSFTFPKCSSQGKDWPRSEILPGPVEHPSQDQDPCVPWSLFLPFRVLSDPLQSITPSPCLWVDQTPQDVWGFASMRYLRVQCPNSIPEGRLVNRSLLLTGGVFLLQERVRAGCQNGAHMLILATQNCLYRQKPGKEKNICHLMQDPARAYLRTE